MQGKWQAAAIAAVSVLLATFVQAAPVIQAGPGAFSYQYLTVSGNSGAGVIFTSVAGAVADPNAAVAGNSQFITDDGGATHYYGNVPISNSPTNSVSYSFVASPGQMFSGNISVKDRETVYSSIGAITGAISLDGGAFTQFDNDPGANPNGADDRRNSNTLNVNGATSFTIRYTLTNLAVGRTQLFRFSSQDTPADSTATDGFFVSGSTAAATPEPGSAALLAVAGFLALRRRRR
ncbi:MAG: hypothetical protein JWN51_924 [Phycisphaerales bacterium]|nr:hypothetical protein [Phycisphaerales bacterium]